MFKNYFNKPIIEQNKRNWKKWHLLVLFVAGTLALSSGITFAMKKTSNNNNEFLGNVISKKLNFENMTKKLETIKTDYPFFYEKNNLLIAKIEEKTQEIDKLNLEIESFKKTINNLENTNAQNLQASKEDKLLIAELKTKISSLENDKINLENQVASYQSEVEFLSAKIESLNDELGEMAKVSQLKIEELQQRIVSLENSGKLKDVFIGELQTKITNLIQEKKLIATSYLDSFYSYLTLLNHLTSYNQTISKFLAEVSEDKVEKLKNELILTNNYQIEDQNLADFVNNLVNLDKNNFYLNYLENDNLNLTKLENNWQQISQISQELFKNHQHNLGVLQRFNQTNQAKIDQLVQENLLQSEIILSSQNEIKNLNLAKSDLLNKLTNYQNLTDQNFAKFLEIATSYHQNILQSFAIASKINDLINEENPAANLWVPLRENWTWNSDNQEFFNTLDLSTYFGSAENINREKVTNFLEKARGSTTTFQNLVTQNFDAIFSFASDTFSRMQELQDKLSNLVIENQNLTIEKDNLKIKVKSLNNIKANYEKSIDVLNAEISEQNTKITNLEKASNTKDEKINILTSKLIDFEAKLKASQETISSQEREILAVQARELALDLENENNKLIIGSQTKELEKQRKQIATNLQTIASNLEIINHQSATIEKNQENITNLENEVNLEKQKVVNLSKTNQQLEGGIAGLKGKIEELTTEIAKLKTENQNLSTQIAQKDEKIATLQAKISELESQNQQLTSQNQSLLSEIQTLKTQLTNLTGENNKLKSKLSELEKQNKAKQSQIDNLNYQIQEKNNLLQSKDRIITQKDRQIQRLQSSISDKNSQINSLRSENSSLESRNNALENQNASLLRELNLKNAEIERLKKEIKRLDELLKRVKRFEIKFYTEKGETISFDLDDFPTSSGSDPQFLRAKYIEQKNIFTYKIQVPSEIKKIRIQFADGSSYIINKQNYWDDPRVIKSSYKYENVLVFKKNPQKYSRFLVNTHRPLASYSIHETHYETRKISDLFEIFNVQWHYEVAQVWESEDEWNVSVYVTGKVTGKEKNIENIEMSSSSSDQIFNGIAHFDENLILTQVKPIE